MKAMHRLLNPGAHYPGLVWGGALVCLTVAAGAGWQVWSQVKSVLQVEQELGRLQAAHMLPPPPQPAKAEIEMRRRWDALAAERSFNWYPVFRALEQSSSTDIELLEFLPDKAGLRIVLRGEAHTGEALTKYIAGLAQQRSFDEVYLSHQKNLVRAGMTLVSFEVRAVIVPQRRSTR